MSTVSGKFSRLQKAFAREGIQVSYRDHIYQIHNEQAAATILLPDSLPLEHKAVSQLLDFASVADPNGHGKVCKACATPDFHPGSIAPVGSVVATSPDFVIPAAIGTDINCGIRLMTTGLNEAQAQLHKSAIVDRLTQAILKNGRDVPVRTQASRRCLMTAHQPLSMSCPIWACGGAWTATVCRPSWLPAWACKALQAKAAMHQKRCCRRAKWCARRRRLIWAVATTFWSSAWWTRFTTAMRPMRPGSRKVMSR